jgi:hypothetical protein
MVTRCGLFTLVNIEIRADIGKEHLIYRRTMMFGFIAAVVAGFVTPQLEAPAARPLAKILSKYMTLEASETRLLAFVIAMLVAGVVGSLLDSGSAFWMILGGALGYFGARLVTAVRTALEARKNT